MTRLAKVSALVLGLLSLGFFWGDDTPDLNAYMDQIKAATNVVCEGRCELVSVTKTDGRAMDMMGSKVYEMRANVTVKLLQDAAYINGPTTTGFIGISASQYWGTKGHAGDVLTLPVTFHFQKFESGWKMDPIRTSAI